MKSRGEIEATLARLHESLERLASTFEELGGAAIPACDRFALLLEEINDKSLNSVVDRELVHPFFGTGSGNGYD